MPNFQELISQALVSRPETTTKIGSWECDVASAQQRKKYPMSRGKETQIKSKAIVKSLM